MDSKSTSQDGDGTDDKSTAGSDDEAPEDDEHQAGEFQQCKLQQ